MVTRLGGACMRIGILLFTLGQCFTVAQAADIKQIISERVSPVEVISIKDSDGREIPAVFRRPPGRKGPMPAMVFFHGGLDQMTVEQLKSAATEHPLDALFLAEGYLTVQATYRSRSDDPQRPETVRSAV